MGWKRHAACRSIRLNLDPINHRRNFMIIDTHGHYTTEPKDLHRFRKDQTTAAKVPRAGAIQTDSVEGRASPNVRSVECPHPENGRPAAARNQRLLRKNALKTQPRR